MKAIRIEADETFKVEIEVEGVVVATQCVYMSSTERTITREGNFYPVTPIEFNSRAISQTEEI